MTKSEKRRKAAVYRLFNKERVREYQKAYQHAYWHANKDRLRAYRKKRKESGEEDVAAAKAARAIYLAKNRERFAARAAAYYAANREKRDAYGKAYRAKNRDAVRARNRAAYQKKREQMPRKVSKTSLALKDIAEGMSRADAAKKHGLSMVTIYNASSRERIAAKKRVAEPQQAPPPSPNL